MGEGVGTNSTVCKRQHKFCLSGMSDSLSMSAMSDSYSPWTVAARLLCSWDSPGKNTGVGSHSLLQGIV